MEYKVRFTKLNAMVIRKPFKNSFEGLFTVILFLLNDKLRKFSYYAGITAEEMVK
jgi:hypothetical protein